MTLYEFLTPISPYIIRLFVTGGDAKREKVYQGVKDDIPIMYLEKTPKFVTISFEEHILNIDLN